MPSQIERIFIRMLVGASLGAALFIAAIVPANELPALAFGQLILYRLEVALFAFYGGLLLVTPAFLGLTRGRLPIEISTRGAKFAEESAALNEAKIEGLKRSTSALTEGLAALDLEIERLKKVNKSDSTHPTVGSQ